MIALISWPRSVEMGPSQATVKQFEDAILDDSSVIRSIATEYLRNRVYGYILGMANRTYRLGAGRYIATRIRNAVPVLELGSNHGFGIMMGREFRKVFPSLQGCSRRSVYCFDAWPKFQERLADFIEFADITDIFVSAAQAAENLRAIMPRRNIIWIPEGICPAYYDSLPLEERDIDIICIGRGYDAWHNSVIETIKSKGVRYRHERASGGLINPSESDFNLALARSKISICVPKSITNPDQAMGVETMTFRYLQSMSSRCLILGHAPKEMIDIFGYNPVIEIDMRNPSAQILDVLKRIHEYRGLIEKNYWAVLERHTWWHRWQQIKSHL